MADSAYLKSELGAVLARGIAETVSARPWDPVHYLGNWLLHYLEENEEEERRKQRRAKEEQEREEWNKVRLMKRGQAAGVIQREWKAFQIQETSRKTGEKDLLIKIQEMEKEIDEVDDYKEEAGLQTTGEDQELTEEEREREQEKARALVTFRKAQALLDRDRMDLSAIGDVKRMQRPAAEIVVVMRCAAYLLFNKKPKDVKTWAQIKNIIKPTPFLIAASALDPGRASGAAGPAGGGEEGEEAAPIHPAAAHVGKKRQFVRVRRVLKGIDPEKIKESSVVVFVILKYLLTASDYREQRDAEIKVKREAGKDVDEEEEEEEEEPTDPEERDEDEERERLREEEEERKKQEEEARMREEMENEEGGEEDDS